MNRLELIRRVRSMTRDLSHTVFRESDIVDFINEGIDRLIQVVPEFNGYVEDADGNKISVTISHLTSPSDVPKLIPQAYHHLLALYSTSRCFGQDERHYQSTTYMNEFEVKLEDLKGRIASGEITIIDPNTGLTVLTPNSTDYVRNNYFFRNDEGDDYDPDPGVEGVTY